MRPEGRGVCRDSGVDGDGDGHVESRPERPCTLAQDAEEDIDAGGTRYLPAVSSLLGHVGRCLDDGKERGNGVAKALSSLAGCLAGWLSGLAVVPVASWTGRGCGPRSLRTCACAANRPEPRKSGA